MRIPKVIPVIGIWVVTISFLGNADLCGQTLTLQISPQSISFPAADPDLEPLIIANQPIQVTMRITGNGNRPWQLTLRADGDLIAYWFIFQVFTINISNINWTAAPSPSFQNGTLVANVAQLAASGSGNLNNYQGNIVFRFQNLWTHYAESYSQTVTFVLSAL